MLKLPATEAWAGTLPESRRMRLIQIEVGQMQNFNYVIGCPATGAAAIVDPAWEVERVLQAATAEGLTVRRILVTHTHHDHIEGVAQAWRATGASISVHELEAERLASQLRADDAAQAEISGIGDDQVIDVGVLEIRTMHTPGHTPGATCYQVPGGVITGDTLFIGRCGRTDFPGSDPLSMYESLRRLAALPGETVIYPGHNYADRPTSTIARERVENTHMSAPDLDEFLRRRMGPEYLTRIGRSRP